MVQRAKLQNHTSTTTMTKRKASTTGSNSIFPTSTSLKTSRSVISNSILGMPESAAVTETSIQEESITTSTSSAALVMLNATPHYMELMDGLLLSNIISFIGPNQYRFVAAIDKSFHASYVNLFPNDTKTYVSASTMGYAKICLDEVRYNKNLICESAAKYGNLPVLQ